MASTPYLSEKLAARESRSGAVPAATVARSGCADCGRGRHCGGNLGLAGRVEATELWGAGGRPAARW
jgi:hypothetical protein